ncbi:MAG: tetratricopeptide repeat protein [Oligoflexales bacterium]
MSIVAKTERLIIRPWTQEDVPHYLTSSMDAGYNCFSTPGRFSVRDKKEATEKVDSRVALFEQRGLGKFLLFTKNGNEFIGTCGIDPYQLDGREEFELGYRLCLRFWNQGYATEAARAILDYGFTTLDLDRIIAFAVHQNTASLKTIEKLKFRYERDFSHAEMPHRLFGYLKEDWIAEHPPVKYPEIAQVAELRLANQPEKAITILADLLHKHPLDPEINYQMAWTHDFMGKEREAVPYYETAIANGLSGEDRKGAMLGLGSTFRCLGEYRKSLEVFDRAVFEFPDDRALKVFRALTLHNLGKSEDAVSHLLLELLDSTSDSSIKSYARALRFYSDKLSETWS